MTDFNDLKFLDKDAFDAYLFTEDMCNKCEFPKEDKILKK